MIFIKQKNLFFGLSMVVLLLGLVIISATFFDHPEPPKQRHLVDKISGIILDYILRTDIDRLSVGLRCMPSEHASLTGVEKLKERIARVVDRGKPVQFNVVGFPHKSQNMIRKVASQLPDAAEQHALEFLNSLLTKISSIYAPGAYLTIFTDGIVFCDVEGIDDAVVFAYEQQLKQLAINMPRIKIATLRDLLPGKSPEAMRNIVAAYSPSVQGFAVRLVHDVKLRDEINLLEKRLMLEFDFPEGHLYVQKHSIHEIAKKLVQRSMQYSAFLATKRDAAAIRCSVHYQQDVSNKLGIKLSQHSHVTPWHGVLRVKTDGSKQIQHKEDCASEQEV